MDQLTYARQFVLGPRPDGGLGWPQCRLRCGLVLQTHPNLPCLQQSLGDRTVTLVGFALTPDRPGQTHEQILAGLLTGAATLDEVLHASDGLSGRWIIIHEDAGRSVLFHDATGLRTVVHTQPVAEETWCASQTNLLATRLGQQPDPQALDFWTKLGGNIPKHIRAWPGRSTAFAALHALLPNHYLDLETRETVRFFPRAAPEPLSLEEGTERIAAHLRAAVAEAHARFEVHQQITAGLDSRTMLAASRDHCRDTEYFTCLWPSIEPGMTEAHLDIDVPNRLLTRLGLPHTIVRCPTTIPDDRYAKAFQATDTVPIDGLGPAAFVLGKSLPSNAIVINSNFGEIGRCRLHPVSHPATVSLAEVCNMHWTGMQHHPFLREHLQFWLDEATDAARDSGYRLLDLFHWELKGSRRVARSILHLDMAHETFSPFNNRALIRLYLGVPEQWRRPASDFALQYGVIRTLWPETLDEGVNPASLADRSKRLVRRIRRRIRRLGIAV